MIHLERFESRGLRVSKLSNSVKIPLSLSFNSYESSDPSMKASFELYGISHHMGSLGGGHYVADVKHNSKWYRCDDSSVHEASPTLSGSSPYLLF